MWNGYVVVNDSYVYTVLYFQSKTPSDSYQESVKVLDSFTFGK